MLYRGHLDRRDLQITTILSWPKDVLIYLLRSPLHDTSPQSGRGRRSDYLGLFLPPRMRPSGAKSCPIIKHVIKSKMCLGEGNLEQLSMLQPTIAFVLHCSCNSNENVPSYLALANKV